MRGRWRFILGTSDGVAGCGLVAVIVISQRAPLKPLGGGKDRERLDMVHATNKAVLNH